MKLSYGRGFVILVNVVLYLLNGNLEHAARDFHNNIIIPLYVWRVFFVLLCIYVTIKTFKCVQCSDVRLHFNIVTFICWRFHYKYKRYILLVPIATRSLRYCFGCNCYKSRLSKMCITDYKIFKNINENGYTKQ